jgi:hypothetical protein
MRLAVDHTANQRVDGGTLVAAWLVVACQLIAHSYHFTAPDRGVPKAVGGFARGADYVMFLAR